MRKLKLFSVLAAATMILTGCTEVPTSTVDPTTVNPTTDNPTTTEPTTEPITSNPTTDDTSDTHTSEPDPTTSTAPVTKADNICFHYRNDDAKTYTDTDLWSWSWKEGDVGQAVDWDGTDEYGAYVTIDLNNYQSKKKIGYIVRTRGQWNVFQTTDCYITPQNFKIEDNAYHVYTLLEMDKSLSVYDSPEPGMADKLKSAIFTDWRKITVTGSNTVTNYRLYKVDSINQETLVTQGVANKKTFEITLSDDIDISDKYYVEGEFNTTERVSQKVCAITNLYYTQKFYNDYTYDDVDSDPLGVSYTENSTTFRLWSPVAQSVKLNVYQKGIPVDYDEASGSDKCTKYEMNKGDHGLWEYTFDSHLGGTYYTYTITNYLGKNEIVDPYAVSLGINGYRGYAIDLNDANTKPAGFDDIEFCDIHSPKELSVYEMHVNDVTYDETWTGKEVNRGKYTGAIEKGTTYSDGNVTVSTGFDHIDELNVNAVQILPFFDFANAEDKEHNEYNWGYNPENYNAPEGAYSKSPTSGLNRIYEVRQMVQGFAQTKAKTRVIMDVVYNHVNNAYSSNFNYVCPGYFFRYNADGSLANGTGCGNEVRSEAPMMKRFIVDSLVHWARDYKIKGFRFDLMGILNCNTLKLAAEKLYELDPTIALYGEAWIAMGDWGEAVSNFQAVSDNVFSYLYPYSGGSTDNPNWDTAPRVGIGCFNDEFRDAYRGKNDFYNTSEFYGLASQGEDNYDSGKADRVKEGIRGIHHNKGGNPNQVVNYVSCHDNFTLFDQLNYTLSDDGGKTEPNINTVGKAVAAIESATMFTEGIAFINGGEELLRTKREVMEEDGTYMGDVKEMVDMYGYKVSHNTYCSNPTVNAFHYDRLCAFKSVSDAIANAVKLRNESHDSFLKYGFPENCNEENVWGWGDAVASGFAIGYKVNGTEYYLMNVNRCSGNTAEVGIGNGQVEVLFSSLDSRVGSKISISNYKITLQKYETVLLKRVK